MKNAKTSATISEKELDVLIERRSRKEPDPDEREETYMESVRRYNAQRRKEIRAAWYCYFCHIAESLRARAEDYERRAEALLEDRGEGVR